MSERIDQGKTLNRTAAYFFVILCLLLSLVAYLLLRGTVTGLLIDSSVKEASWASVDLITSIVSIAIVAALAVFNLWFFPRMQKKRRLLLWGLIESGALIAVCAGLVILQIL